MKLMGLLVLLCVTIAIAAVCVLAAANYFRLGHGYQKLTTSQEVVVGRADSNTLITHWRGGSSYYANYTFSVDGNEYRGSAREFTLVESDQEISVRYEKGNPSNSIPADQDPGAASEWNYFLAWTVVGAALLGLSVIGISVFNAVKNSLKA